MEIEAIEKCERPMPSGATQSYPAGWKGDVPEPWASQFITAGKARALMPAAGAFTAEETLALKAVASGVLEAHAAATAGQPEPDGDTGEPIKLADLSLEELRAIGVELEIKGAARMSKAKIIAAIEQMQADAADPVAVAAAAAEGTAEALEGGSGEGESAS